MDEPEEVLPLSQHRNQQIANTNTLSVSHKLALLTLSVPAVGILSLVWTCVAE